MDPVPRLRAPAAPPWVPIGTLAPGHWYGPCAATQLLHHSCPLLLPLPDHCHFSRHCHHPFPFPFVCAPTVAASHPLPPLPLPAATCPTPTHHCHSPLPSAATTGASCPLCRYSPVCRASRWEGGSAGCSAWARVGVQCVLPQRQ